MTAIQREFIPVNIAVLTVSDSRTEADDKSGKLLVSRLNDAGHQLFEKTIVKDDIFAVRAVISNWIAEPDAQVVVTTGGTGVTGFDGTPEAVHPLLEKTLDGFGEVFRMISYEEIGTSTLQSRAIAGVALGRENWADRRVIRARTCGGACFADGMSRYTNDFVWAQGSPCMCARLPLRQMDAVGDFRRFHVGIHQDFSVIGLREFQNRFDKFYALVRIKILFTYHNPAATAVEGALKRSFQRNANHGPVCD